MTAENQSNDRSIQAGNVDGSTLIAGDGNTVNQGPVYYQTVVDGAIQPAGGGDTQSPPYFFPDVFAGSVFVGRAGDLQNLYERLQQGDRPVIAAVGMGGIGKTTLARWYVKQHQKDYPGGIWWLPAAQLVTQVLAYAGRSVGLEELRPDLSNEQIVQHYLARWEAKWPGRKLLVLDDVGEYKCIKGFLPQQGAFQVLMTTRVQMQPPVQRLQLGVLTPSAALALLGELLGEDARLAQEPTVAAALCKWLGYLPLGIELVGRYLSESRASLMAVFDRLKGRALGARMIATVPDEMDYEHNIEAAFDLSWQTLDAQGQTVALLLGVFALAPIAAAWVVASLPAWDELDVCDCLEQQLVKRSFVSRTPDGYELHGLVREFLQAQLVSEAWEEQSAPLAKGFAEAMTAIAKTIPPTATLSDRARVLMAVPHLEAVAAQWTATLDDEDKTWCCEGLARFYESMSRWAEAERCRLRSLEISKLELGDRHPYTAHSLNNLAGLYYSQGRYAEAKPLYLEVLEIRKAVLGDRHPDTAQSLSNLALLYYSQGRYAEAEPLYLEALEISKSELGNRHPDTAQSLNNLASLYYSQGRYTEAEPLYLKALEIRKTELGDRHPDTAQSLNNLAGLYYSQGRYAEVKPLYLEALEIRKTELGHRHPDTAQSLNNLAELYRSQGRYAEAKPLYLEVLEIRKAELGDRHPDTAQSLSNLALLYYSQGRYTEAEPLYLEALEIRKAELGDRHPDTATSLNNLAALYYNTNRLPEAATTMSSVVSIFEELLGPNHPNTITVRENLEGIQQALSTQSSRED